jgi:ABC-type transport system involved in multi-copper enzyme maturation permease subunit
MKNIITIAKKEYTDATRSALFLILSGFLLLLIGISILIASLDFSTQVAQYNAALAQLTQAQRAGATLSAPQYHPLQMLRGSIEYFEIIGAVIAIVLGYLSIAKEKGTNTAQLLLTRPIDRKDLLGGKILGNSALLLSLIGIVYIFIIVAVTAIGHVAFSGIEVLKLTLAMVFTYFYLTFFYSFSAALALIMRDLPRALMLSFSLWLVFVLIVPQIGDTMDPDNQVPGGFFASMHVNQKEQKQIIGQFQGYENFRNAVEVTSVEKHYERLVFATLGIKLTYSDKPLSHIFHDKWPDLTVLAVFYVVGIGLMLVFGKKRRIMASSP